MTVCGGGNGAHVLAGLAASAPNVVSRVLTLFADEADRWTAAMKDHEFTLKKFHDGAEVATVKGNPHLVTKDAQKAADGCDVIIFVVPAFAHEQYLRELAPHIKPGMVVVGLPGQAGFEFAIRGILGDKAKACTIINFESLPWACRIKEFGKVTEVLGTKLALQGAILKGTTAPPEDAVGMVQRALGPNPVLQVHGHVLGMSLMAVNAYIHPSIMYGRWHAWDGKPVDSPPIFYNEVTEEGASTLVSMSDEIIALKTEIVKQRPNTDLTNTTHIYDWYIKCYEKEITDKTNLKSVLLTNKAYKGLTHPTKKTEDGKFVPDFGYRYMTEDIPFGLVVLRGIAEVAGVPTPAMDKALQWAQGIMKKEYLVDGKLAGKDMGTTRSPQKYGLTTIDQVLGN